MSWIYNIWTEELNERTSRQVKVLTVLVEGTTGEDLVQEVTRNLADSGKQRISKKCLNEIHSIL